MFDSNSIKKSLNKFSILIPIGLFSFKSGALSKFCREMNKRCSMKTDYQPIVSINFPFQRKIAIRFRHHIWNWLRNLDAMQKLYRGIYRISMDWSGIVTVPVFFRTFRGDLFNFLDYG